MFAERPGLDGIGYGFSGFMGLAGLTGLAGLAGFVTAALAKTDSSGMAPG
jgi:hypothetical protein